jgi:hypothetical protein
MGHMEPMNAVAKYHVFYEGLNLSVVLYFDLFNMPIRRIKVETRTKKCRRWTQTVGNFDKVR